MAVVGVVIAVRMYKTEFYSAPFFPQTLVVIWRGLEFNRTTVPHDYHHYCTPFVSITDSYSFRLASMIMKAALDFSLKNLGWIVVDQKGNQTESSKRMWGYIPDNIVSEKI